MNCPRCAGELRQVMVALCRAYTCSGCSGVWVPFEACEAVMPRLVELAPEEAPSAPASAAEKIKCPGCGGDLVTVKAHGAGGITVRTCLVCFGRWVDGWELGKTRGKGLMGMLRAMLRRLAPKDKPPRPAVSPANAAAPAQPPSEESARTETPKQE